MVSNSFVRDGKYSERRWACTLSAHPHQPVAEAASLRWIPRGTLLVPDF
jgi:hypothetical protein